METDEAAVVAATSRLLASFRPIATTMYIDPVGYWEEMRDRLVGRGGGASGDMIGNWKPIYQVSDLERKFRFKLSIGIHNQRVCNSAAQQQEPELMSTEMMKIEEEEVDCISWSSSSPLMSLMMMCN